MNRRAVPRAKVDILINRFLDGHPYMCRMIDISPTGSRLVPLLEPRTPGRYMGLQFQLPGTDTVVTASAEVVNGNAGPAGRGVGPAGHGATGVRFTSLSRESASMIRRFVEAS